MFVGCSLPIHPLTTPSCQPFIKRSLTDSLIVHGLFITGSLIIRYFFMILHFTFIIGSSLTTTSCQVLHLVVHFMISFAHALARDPIQFLMLFASFVHSDMGARLFFFWSLGSILIIFHQNSRVGTIFGTDLRELKSWKNPVIQTPFTPHMIFTNGLSPTIIKKNFNFNFYMIRNSKYETKWWFSGLNRYLVNVRTGFSQAIHSFKKHFKEESNQDTYNYNHMGKIIARSKPQQHHIKLERGVTISWKDRMSMCYLNEMTYYEDKPNVTKGNVNPNIYI